MIAMGRWVLSAEKDKEAANGRWEKSKPQKRLAWRMIPGLQAERLDILGLNPD